VIDFAIRNLPRSSFFTTGIPRLVIGKQANYLIRKVLNRCREVTPFLEADSYLRGIIISTISLSDRGRPPRRVARTYFSDLRRYHGEALIPPFYSSLLDEIYAHVHSEYASCTLPNHLKPFSGSKILRSTSRIQKSQDRQLNFLLRYF